MTSAPLNSALASSSCSLVLPQSQKTWVSRGLESDNPFVFNLSKTSLVLVIIKLPFRVVLSALCIDSASVCGHSALMIARITMTAFAGQKNMHKW